MERLAGLPYKLYHSQMVVIHRTVFDKFREIAFREKLMTSLCFGKD